MKYYFLVIILITLYTCSKPESKSTQSMVSPYPTLGSIERIDSAINAVIPPDAQIEQIAEGLTWSEGPLWIEQHQMLLFSDVVKNRIYRWTANEGLAVYLEPSGFTGDTTDSREKGSNGLILNPDGQLVLCQHGNRQVARMESSLDAPQPQFQTVVDNYRGKRFNSPNDLIYDSKGNLYFTDPPFGLSEAMMEDPKKELPFQGVYRYDTQGKLILLTASMSRPNGVALSKDEKTLYVANADPEQAVWYAFDIEGDTLVNERIIYDATDLVGTALGLPDGVDVDDRGNIFTAGPGGIWIFTEDFKLLGKIKTKYWMTNCAFDTDYATLYITADDHVLRLRLK